MYESFNPVSWSWLILILVVWSSVWKAIALWKAARNNSQPWFVALFIINTIGILDILYIYVFGKKKEPMTPLQM